MRLIDTKLPKQSMEELKKDMPGKEEGPRYPYGLKITFDEEIINKMPHLENMKIGERVSISGIGEVVSIRMNEDKDKKKRYSIEIQIQQVGVASKEDFDEAFKEATEEKTQPKKSMERVAESAIKADENAIMR